LILVTTAKGVKREALSAHATRSGMTELAVPKTIFEVDKMPVLGTGKTDYVAVQALVKSKMEKAV
jgi:acyl-[acyl-carrier-protein]-phospholipid O-acyltransferase / long-chain-fatty-acid--[acyl-carrier-protein] ligase